MMAQGENPGFFLSENTIHKGGKLYWDGLARELSLKYLKRNKMTQSNQRGRMALAAAKHDLKAICQLLTKQYNVSPYSKEGRFLNDFNADLIASLLKLEHFLESQGKK